MGSHYLTLGGLARTDCLPQFLSCRTTQVRVSNRSQAQPTTRTTSLIYWYRAADGQRLLGPAKKDLG